MKKIFKGIGILVGIIAIFVLTIILLTPWMDKKGTTAEER